MLRPPDPLECSILDQVSCGEKSPHDTETGEVLVLAEGLRDYEFLTTETHQLYQYRAVWTLADPQLIKLHRAFRRQFRAYGIPMYVHTAYRSPEEQNRLYVMGRSRAKAGQSKHQIGKAFDYVHSRHHWNLTREAWSQIGEMGKDIARRANIKVRWGGDFKSLYDPAHWELVE